MTIERSVLQQRNTQALERVFQVQQDLRQQPIRIHCEKQPGPTPTLVERRAWSRTAICIAR